MWSFWFSSLLCRLNKQLSQTWKSLWKWSVTTFAYWDILYCYCSIAYGFKMSFGSETTNYFPSITYSKLYKFEQKYLKIRLIQYATCVSCKSNLIDNKIHCFRTLLSCVNLGGSWHSPPMHQQALSKNWTFLLPWVHIILFPFYKIQQWFISFRISKSTATLKYTYTMFFF